MVEKILDVVATETVVLIPDKFNKSYGLSSNTSEILYWNEVFKILMIIIIII